jgi:catechol 2,3-dioxygenase-like lactoylglutathione lyase family enzyme
MDSIGIRHVHLLVADSDRAVEFYRKAFGMQERFRDGPIVFVGTPAGGDSLALHQATTGAEHARVGQLGGWEHFGIHVRDRSTAGIDAAIERVTAAGGSLLERGQHATGAPFAYVADPDGYVIEL